MSATSATEEDVTSATTPEKSTQTGEKHTQARFLAYLRDLYKHVPERRRERHEVEE